MASEFSNVWTPAEAATRDPFHLGPFLALVWENTSGYLLAACLVSLAAALLSWVYMIGAAPLGRPDHQPTTHGTTTRSPTHRAARDRPPAAKDPDADDAPDDGDDASDDASDAGDDGRRRAVPPPPPDTPEEPDSPEETDSLEEAVPDLVEMAHHLPARVKQAELRHIRQRLQSDMTDEQRRREKQVERDQMAAILDLMQQNSDKFGRPSLDDMQSQLKLYM